jgi:hypothetical protein
MGERGILSILKRTERSDINSASGGSIFNLQFLIPACPGWVKTKPRHPPGLRKSKG